MKQEQQLPTQKELENYIAQAKDLRNEALRSQLNHLLRLPGRIMERVFRIVELKKSTGRAAADKA